MKCRSNHVVDVELLQFDRVLLFHQPAEVPDDLGRAPIVAAYVGEDLLDPLDIRRVGLEKELRSLGIALDRPERLVELMRDGSRQRARGRGAVQVNDFQQPPAQFLLRDPAAAMLEQQPCDQRGLQKNDRNGPDDLLAVVIPQRGLAKAYLASDRQPVFADPEALQLSPVENGSGEITGGNRNLRNIFAVKDTQRESSPSLHRRGQER